MPNASDNGSPRADGRHQEGMLLADLSIRTAGPGPRLANVRVTGGVGSHDADMEPQWTSTVNARVPPLLPVNETAA